MFDESYAEDYHFSRQYKRASNKYTHHKAITRSAAITNRNILQKEKQICDKYSRIYRELERQQKREGVADEDAAARTYHCTTCYRNTEEPCRCNYIQWCGKECEWDHCIESKRLGFRNQLAVSYDVLCDYHSRKYFEYLEESFNDTPAELPT